MPAPNNSATLQLALGVLESFSVHMKQPDPQALLKLREMAMGPFERALADDELACFIVHRELALRTRASRESTPKAA